MGSVFTYERDIHFDDCDPAGIVFFANHFRFCHEAMEAFFGQVPDRYTGLVLKRRIGFPAVQAHAEYKAPLKYGDGMRIEVTLERVGNSSASFRYLMYRTSDGTLAAEVKTTCVHAALETYTSTPFTDDLRALLTKHLA